MPVIWKFGRHLAWIGMWMQGKVLERKKKYESTGFPEDLEIRESLKKIWKIFVSFYYSHHNSSRFLSKSQSLAWKIRSLDRSHYWQESRQKLTFWKRCFLINFENMPNKNRHCNHNQHAQLLYVRVNSSWQMLTEPGLIGIQDLPVSERCVQRCENVR